MEKIIPPGLNYADIKPEAIENQIRAVRFLPHSNIRDQRPNDVIRFHLQGNGFFDPYSAYIKILVQCDGDIAEPGAAGDLSGLFLDRSGHSLINRLVIRSQGTELERIEQYDVMAAMINDMCYSNEQRHLHHMEGFPSKSYVQNIQLNHDENYRAAEAVSFFNTDNLPNVVDGVVDKGFWKIKYQAAATNYNPAAGQHIDLAAAINIARTAASLIQPEAPAGLGNLGQVINGEAFYNRGVQNLQLVAANADLGIARPGNDQIVTSPQTMELCIPIYSGILGVLMPEKKFLPLSLMPLEVEFTLNPHAFYCVGAHQNRSYIIKTFEIWTHTLFFEQELHRSLEAVVADAGIFIHYESFYLTPINTYSTQVPAKFQQLAIYLKSVEAIHWVFLYTGYQTTVNRKKLHFVSHNLQNLQLRNGMDLMPSEPISSRVTAAHYGAGGRINSHCQILTETYKGWNKMHDPLADGALQCAFQYQIDQAQAGYGPAIDNYVYRQIATGRCQYALSLVGEELGQSKNIICGKKTVLPFDLNFDAQKFTDETSIMLAFLRADFIIYVRPDLIVTRLGI